MQFKTDTKEKFHAIRLPGPSLSATMTEDLATGLLKYLQIDGTGADAWLPAAIDEKSNEPLPPTRNVILIMKDIESIDNAAAEKLVELQQRFYENNASFVICELQPAVEDFLDKCELLEIMNVTPSQSEAWDIVQMEEIERELLDDPS